MDREKFTDCIYALRDLTEDWANVETEVAEKALEPLIIAKATELVNLADATELLKSFHQPKKSEMACNCCGEEIDAMKEMSRAVDMFINAANKLASKDKF